MMASRADFSIGRVLFRAAGAIRAAPVRFFGTGFALTALPAILVLLAAAGADERSRPDDPADGVGLLIGFGVLAAWFGMLLFAQALLFRATVAWADDRPERPGERLGAAAASLVPLFALAVVITIAVAIGWALFFIPGAMLATAWSVAAPALVAERCGPWAALDRSRTLTSGARWRVFGLLAVVGVAALLATSVTGAVGAAADGALGSSLPSSIVTLASAAALVTVAAVLQAALYVELRDARDGAPADRLSAIFS